MELDLNSFNSADDSTVVYRGSYEDTPENKSILIASGIAEIAENAFRDFENLEEVTIPPSVRKIGACAFSGCQRLKRVRLSFGLIEIADEAFSSCPSLNEIIIPDSCESIGEGAFEACASLTNVKLSERLKVIGSCAFAFCLPLSSKYRQVQK